jgi:hypothetical protein
MKSVQNCSLGQQMQEAQVLSSRLSSLICVICAICGFVFARQRLRHYFPHQTLPLIGDLGSLIGPLAVIAIE